MTDKPKVSIIVPIYRVEKYLRKCLDSIAIQTYRDFECVMVNDGSPDGCEEICKEFVLKDARFKLICKENGGISSARNVGLDVAKGEYIAFVDSDDYVEPAYLETLVNCIYSADIGMVSFVEHTEENSIAVESNGATYELSIDEVVGKLSGYVWQRLFKSRIIKDNGLRFDETLYMLEDTLFNIEYCSFVKEGKAVISNSKLYHYITRGDSLIHTKFDPKIFAIIHIRDTIENTVRREFPEKINLSIAQRCIIIQWALYKIKKYYNGNDKRKQISRLKRDLRKNIKYILKDRSVIAPRIKICCLIMMVNVTLACMLKDLYNSRKI